MQHRACIRFDRSPSKNFSRFILCVFSLTILAKIIYECLEVIIAVLDLRGIGVDIDQNTKYITQHPALLCSTSNRPT